MNESCCQATHWIKPCGWWIWPKSLWCLSFPLCLCLHPTPTQEFIKAHQSAVRSGGTCFLSCFQRFMSNPCLIPLYASPPLFLFPASWVSPPLSLTAWCFKYQANVWNVQLNTSTLGEGIHYLHRGAASEEIEKERGGKGRQHHIRLITEGYSILLRSSAS